MNKKSLVAFIATVAVLLPLSLFADSRPQYRTNLGGNSGYGMRSGQIDGIVRDVRNNGREVVLATRWGIEVVSVNGGTRIWYRGRQFHIADLDRGDRIRVMLNGNGKKLKAKSIEVLQSVSDGYGRYGNGYPYGYGSPNYTTVYGTVSQIDRWNDRVQVRTDAGRYFWVDGRSARGASASQLRAGDRVAVRGVSDRGTFRATEISLNDRYGSYDRNGQYGQRGDDDDDGD